MWSGYRTYLYCLLCCLLVSLSACGGGGGGSGGSTGSTGNPVGVVNTVPVANAGVSRSVATGTVVTLDGVGSTDVDGDSLTYKWTLVTRPAGSVAALVNNTTISPGFTADSDGIYVISLIVNDGKSDSIASIVNITAVSNPTLLFATTPISSGVSLNGIIQPGAIFGLTIKNNSQSTFNLDRAELSNGGIVIGSSSSPALLNNNVLGPAESAGISFTINSAPLDNGIRLTYFFTNPVTQSQFTVYWDYI